MSLQAQYRKFFKKIALTRESDQYREVREKDDMITEKVTVAFSEAGYTVEETFIQGSLATHTGVIPIDGDYDIDRAIVISSDGAPKDPVDAKKLLRDVLIEHGFKTPRIKNPCVTADYRAKNLHIDFPIYRKTWFSGLQLAWGKENSNPEVKSWNDADPKGLIEWITSDTDHQAFFGTLSKDERSQFYRLVRAAKRWRDTVFAGEATRKKVYSVALTIMIRECFLPSIDSETTAVNDHASLLSTIEKILEPNRYFKDMGQGKFSVAVHLPVSPNNNLYPSLDTAFGTTFRNKLAKLRDKLLAASEGDSLEDQCKILATQFGEDFPIPDDPSGGKGSSGLIKSSTPGIVGVSHGA